MPASGRPEMSAEAAHSFLRQTWADKELVIVDDGDIPIKPWLPDHESIRYFQFPPLRLSIGLKRNIACELARGEYIIHWDSDDKYADDRIEHQMASIADHPRAAVSGWRTMKFETPEGRQWLYSGPPYTAVGVSLLYKKSHWLIHPFECRSEGEDTSFAFKSAAINRLHSVDGNDRIIARLHKGNTSPKDLTGQQWKEL